MEVLCVIYAPLFEPSQIFFIQSHVVRNQTLFPTLLFLIQRFANFNFFVKFDVTSISTFHENQRFVEFNFSSNSQYLYYDQKTFFYNFFSPHHSATIPP
ncbi:unnamed protein product [Nesidiocoris tenuis]|uniref:Uncharacterized protein n=1 Tax=Nesidiocoris tenuis TaxID=355587 RepID=A0A6H5HUA7_9HEMI|nr:unnamed protein product [Nesidiocoris tenuis]